MRIVIYIFSGTGNTALVAGLYKKHLEGCDVTIWRIGNESPPPSPEEFDLVGFGYPVHGFNAPKVMVDFCRALPAAGGKNEKAKRCFIMKTSGEGLSFNNYSSQKMIRILERKGYYFASERHYVMPYNMIFRHSPEMVKSEYIYADKMVRLHARGLLSMKDENVHTNPLMGWFVPLFRIEWLYAQAQGPFMRVDMEKCVKCMKCVKGCPLHNINYNDGKFKFGTNCALCVCCSFNCPRNAISIGLLNGWKINGSYDIEKTASDSSIPFPYFGENLRGFHRWLYYKYYRNCDRALSDAGITLV
ncbi:MAG TPA: 4Fe-4S ferredoxin [Treponema sp.]|jgi:ferredoxin/flavodoxin|nr:4Fe-4S ferredoxin [Treponema sp.]HBB42561.1 4Fe-4S ferredoxin [Treponema sp.]